MVCRTELIGQQKKYCSLKCRTKDYYSKYYIHFEWRVNRKCIICQKDFIPSRINKKVCSEYCLKYKKNLWKRNKSSKVRGVCNCKWCKNEFKPKTMIQFFCCEKCATKQYMKDVMGVKQVDYRGTEHQCIVCEKRYKAYSPKQKYCSSKCRRKADYKKNWKRKVIAVHIRKGRKVNGGGNFTLEEWEQLKKKTNYSCNKCGKPESEVKLTIDHIVPISKWAEWSKINKPSYGLSDIENIQPLCEKCNNLKRANIL